MRSSRLRAPTPGEQADAAAAVAAHLAPTPLLAAEVPTPTGARRVWLKLETLQPTGSFKIRGALAALTSIPVDAHAVSASAGNHALGLCQAARWLGRTVTVVTPEDASPAKVAAIRALVDAPGDGRPGPTLVLHGHGYEQAEAHARALAAADPAVVYVSAYSDAAVIAGQGTLVAEVADQLPAGTGPVRLVVPLGGGGLASGIGLALAGRPGWDLSAVEVQASPAVSAAVAAGRRVEVAVEASLADGLVGNLEEACPTPGILRDLRERGLADLAAVSEAEVRAAVRFAFARLGLVVEGAGAAGLAAVVSGKMEKGAAGWGAGDETERALVVVLSGRNIAAPAFTAVLATPD